MTNQRFKSVWDALEDDPSVREDMKLRSELMIHITEKIKKAHITQQEAAKVLRVTQPRVSALLQGKINEFRVGTLITLAHRLGLHISLKIESLKDAA